MRFERSQFLDRPKRALVNSMMDTAGVCRGWRPDRLQSWFSHTNDFSEQNRKLRKEESKIPETKKL